MRLPAYLLLALTLAAAGASPAVTDEERLTVYREFRALFDAKNYPESLPLAEKLVALTEEQYGKEARELANPLTNLATVQYRLGQNAAALENYQRGIRILEATASPTDAQLLSPLHGLGLTYMADKNYRDAAPALKRAVDLSRNLTGLY